MLSKYITEVFILRLLYELAPSPIAFLEASNSICVKIIILVGFYQPGRTQFNIYNSVGKTISQHFINKYTQFEQKCTSKEKLIVFYHSIFIFPFIYMYGKCEIQIQNFQNHILNVAACVIYLPPHIKTAFMNVHSNIVFGAVHKSTDHCRRGWV